MSKCRFRRSRIDMNTTKNTYVKYLVHKERNNGIYDIVYKYRPSALIYLLLIFDISIIQLELYIYFRLLHHRTNLQSFFIISRTLKDRYFRNLSTREFIFQKFSKSSHLFEIAKSSKTRQIG